MANMMGGMSQSQPQPQSRPHQTNQFGQSSNSFGGFGGGQPRQSGQQFGQSSNSFGGGFGGFGGGQPRQGMPNTNQFGQPSNSFGGEAQQKRAPYNRRENNQNISEEYLDVPTWLRQRGSK